VNQNYSWVTSRMRQISEILWKEVCWLPLSM
jgi:hypothetical protein